MEKDNSNKETDDEIDNGTKEVDINNNGEFIETDNDEFIVDAANDAPHPQDAPTNTTTTEAATKEGGGEDDVSAEDNKADYTKYGGEGGISCSQSRGQKRQRQR